MALSGTAVRYVAPEQIKTKSVDLGELRENQLLFTTDPGGNVLIFAAWWPWGNGEVVSVRIASPSNGEQPPEAQGILSKIKWFLAKG